MWRLCNLRITSHKTFCNEKKRIFFFLFLLVKSWDVGRKGKLRTVAVIKFLIPWCCIQNAMQKFTVAGRIVKVRRSICFTSRKLEEKEFLAWPRPWGAWFFYCAWSLNHAACYHLNLSCLQVLQWAALKKKKKKKKPGKKHWKLFIPFWKAFCPGWGWLFSSLNSNCQVKI